jgi:predicted nucleotidyltransferase
MRDVVAKLYRADEVQRADIQRTLASALAGASDVVFAYLHGSFLDGARFHDVDVGVYLIGPSETHARRALELSDRLSSEVGVPVDARPLNDAPVSFRFHVVRGKLLFSRDEETLADLIERTVQRYLDMAPLLRRATVEAFGP